MYLKVSDFEELEITGVALVVVAFMDFVLVFAEGGVGGERLVCLGAEDAVPCCLLVFLRSPLCFFGSLTFGPSLGLWFYFLKKGK